MIDSVFNSLRTLPAFLTNILYVCEEEKEAGKLLITLKNAAIQLIFFIIIFMNHLFDFPFLKFSNHHTISRKQNYCFVVYVTKLTGYINVCERCTS